MTGVIITSAVAPVLAAPSLRAEQVSQLVLGEGAEVLESQGTMLRVRTSLDGYQGWVAAGYAVRVALAELELWLASALWSLGALLETGSGVAMRAAHRARVAVDPEQTVRLPDGRTATVLTGAIVSRDEMIREAMTESPSAWAWREFAGTPYLWGGITGAGIDCSGLVQNTFVARGVTLPRDAHDQAGSGSVVDEGGWREGDVLYFRGSDSERISHAAIVGTDATIVHSALDTGGVTRESIAPGSRAHPLLQRLVAVRRFT